MVRILSLSALLALLLLAPAVPARAACLPPDWTPPQPGPLSEIDNPDRLGVVDSLLTPIFRDNLLIPGGFVDITTSSTHQGKVSIQVTGGSPISCDGSWIDHPNSWSFDLGIEDASGNYFPITLTGGLITFKTGSGALLGTKNLNSTEIDDWFYQGNYTSGYPSQLDPGEYCFGCLQAHLDGNTSGSMEFTFDYTYCEDLFFINSTYPKACGEVAAQNDYVFLAAGVNGVEVVNVADKSNPAWFATISSNGTVVGLHISATTLYMANSDGNGIWSCNITTPDDTSAKKKYGESNSYTDLWVDGDYLYALGGNNLDIFNWTTAVDYVWQTTTGSVATGAAYDVMVSGNYAYVAAGANGLKIYDITDKATPTFAGSQATTNALGVWVSGNYAYVADGTAGLRIIDVSNPEATSIVGTYDTPSLASGLKIFNSYAYIADESGGLQVVDISAPTNPRLVGAAVTASAVTEIAMTSTAYQYLGGGNAMIITRNQHSCDSGTVKGVVSLSCD